MQRMSCGVTMSAERTVPITCTSLLKPFGQSGRIGRSIMRAVRIARSVGAALALEEAAGDLPGGVHALLDVDGQREEVRAFARLHPADGRREHHRLAGADDDRAVCLLGELAALECDLLAADRRRTRSRCAGPACSVCYLHLSVGRWRFEPASRRGAALAQTSTLRCSSFEPPPTCGARAP